MKEFKKELEILINKHSIENYADMPDFMMAEMICGFIVGVGSCIKANLTWHGCDSVCHPKEEYDKADIRSQGATHIAQAKEVSDE